MKKLIGLQYLRGLAALAVVVFHAAEKTDHKFLLGEAGVDLFFVLSGFLMVVITDDKSRPWAFLIGRIRRICPLYWLATSVTLVGALAGLFPRMRLTAWHLLSSYMFIPSFSPSNGRVWPLLVPGWTLNYEAMFYAVFAALILLRSQIYQLILLTLVFICLVFYGELMHPVGAIFSTYTDPIILEFVMGCWIAFIWKRHQEWRRFIGWPTLLVACLLFVVAYQMHTDRMRFLIFGIPAALAVLSVLGVEQQGQMPRLRFVLGLGDASYSIYLWHVLAISVVVKICLGLHCPAGFTFVISIFGGVTVGWLGFKMVEAPLIWFLRPSVRTGKFSEQVQIVEVA